MKYNNKKSCLTSSIFSTTDDIPCSDKSYFLEKYTHTTKKTKKSKQKSNNCDTDKSYFLEKHSSIPCTSTSTCHCEPKTNIIHIPIYYPNNYWYKVKC